MFDTTQHINDADKVPRHVFGLCRDLDPTCDVLNPHLRVGGGGRNVLSTSQECIRDDVNALEQ